MTEFRTRIPNITFPFRIHHQHKVLCSGSCFAKHMGKRLGQYQFNSLLNPFGILYNPISIAQGLETLLHDQPFPADQLFKHQELWHSFDHHGSFSGSDKEAVLQNINQQLNHGRAFLQQANRIILTLGTAYTFVNQTTGQVVANCHKLPATQFERRLLSVDACVSVLSKVLKSIKSITPDLEVIISVSPIRHIRDGLIQNQRSKASLLLAAAQLENDLEYVHYFPAYEIVMDDLRDYRFYESDFIHPNSQAVDYIWNYFKDAFFEKETSKLILEINTIVQASRHRPFHVASAAHQDFISGQLKKIDELVQRHSFLDMSDLKKVFLDQII